MEENAMKMNRLPEYEDYGKGPAVVLLHDKLLNPESWKAQVEIMLTAGFRVVIPDFSQFGGVENIESFGRSVIELLDRLGVGRAAFCGVGMGGTVLLSILERYQHRVVGAGFINTRPVQDDVHEKLKRAQVLTALANDDLMARDDLLKMLFCGREKYLSYAVRQELKKIVRDYDHGALNAHLKAVQQRKSYMPLLEKIEIPTQVIYGKHDMICHPGYADLMASSLPNCLKVVGLDGGHLLQYEQGKALTAELMEFLQMIVPRRARTKLVLPLMAA